MSVRDGLEGFDKITLPHQMEFLSDRWLEEARRFLDEDPGARKAQRLSRPFSLSERYTDAPPHLKAPGNVAAWSLRFDGETRRSKPFTPTERQTLESYL